MNTTSLIQSITAAADGSLDGIENEDRIQLMTACDQLRRSLETPLEASERFLFGVHQAIAVRLGIDMKIFDTICALASDGSEVTTEQVANETGKDGLLLTRVMRVLAGMGVLIEKGPNTFSPSKLAGAYVSASPLSDGVLHLNLHADVLTRLPEYFEINGYKCPDDAYGGPFQFAKGTKLHAFEWLETKPRDQKAFNKFMSIAGRNKGEDWFEYFPVEEKLRSEHTRPLLVDIGGGRGHDLVSLKNRFPNLSGECIVQDLPSVIDDAEDLPQSVTAMAHDFFAPQPVIGAKAYYLRAVLHDWPDKLARQILENIKVSMSKDSMLLVSEIVMPDSNAPLFNAEVDLSMMAMFSAIDRTQAQFQELFDSAGLDLVNIWTPKEITPGSRTLFETVPR